MDSKYIIKTEKQYEEMMIELFELQEKEGLTPEDLKEIELMIKAAEKYEAEEL